MYNEGQGLSGGQRAWSRTLNYDGRGQESLVKALSHTVVLWWCNMYHLWVGNGTVCMQLLSIRVHLSPGSGCGLLAYASARRYYNFPHICG